MVKCNNCGKENPDNANFCDSCGTSLKAIVNDEPKVDERITQSEYIREDEETEDVIEEQTETESGEEKPKKKRQKKEKPVEVQKISENISLYSDGKYRWVYEYSLFKNLGIYFTIWKIFFFIMLAGVVLGFFVQMGDSNFFWEGFLKFIKGWGIGFVFMTGITLLGYALYALIMGGKYCVIFEMDEKGINHIQMQKQVSKVQALGMLTMLVGLAGKSPATVGLGINSSIKTSMPSDFSKVRRMKITPLSKIFKLNEPFGHNQVYIHKEDFEFVTKYIIEKCVNARNYQKMVDKYCK